MNTKKTGSMKLIALLFLLPVAACRYDMQDMPRYEPYEQSDFFRDNQASRHPVKGTVARGHLNEDTYFYTGKNSQATGQGTTTTNVEQPNQNALTGATAPNQPQSTAAARPISGSDIIPMPVTLEVLKRGKERYEITCSACHGYSGYGDGMVAQRGFKRPPSFHTDQLRQAPASHYFDAMTNGFGVMPSYSKQITAEDRWKIVAYIRALQLSQNANINDVPPAEVPKMEAGGE